MRGQRQPDEAHPRDWKNAWKKENGYGVKWKVECIFSVLKRILMYILRAKTKWNCIQETLNMVLANNMYKNIRVQMRKA